MQCVLDPKKHTGQSQVRQALGIVVRGSKETEREGGGGERDGHWQQTSRTNEATQTTKAGKTGSRDHGDQERTTGTGRNCNRDQPLLAVTKSK